MLAPPWQLRHSTVLLHGVVLLLAYQSEAALQVRRGSSKTLPDLLELNATVALQRLVAAETTPPTPAPSEQWPHSLSLDPPPPFPFQRQWKMDAEDLAAWESRIREFHMKHEVNKSSFWEAVCKGMNASFNATAYNGHSLKASMHGWHLKTKHTCPAEATYEEFTDETSAVEACGASCAAIVDVGCNMSRFQLCKVGAIEVPSLEEGSCLHFRIPDHPPHEGESQAPLMPDFWDEFCESERFGHASLRVLFTHRLCSTGKVLTAGAPPHSPTHCAQLAAQDSYCSEIFDFNASYPQACRCLPKGMSCDAPVPTGDMDEVPLVNVYIRET